VKSRLGERLEAARVRSCVGREQERELFRRALTELPPPFAVLFVFGPGGIGKSTLLGMFADDARARGRKIVSLSGDDISPSPDQLICALCRSLGQEDQPGLEPFADLERLVLLVDAYEKLAVLDAWFRGRLLPALPADALVVIASREPPDPAFRADPGWKDLLRVLSLRNLNREESSRLLASRGVETGLHGRAHAETHGHPLALSLVADVIAEGGSTEPLLSPDVVQALLSTFVERVPSPVHRAALEVCAHARVTDESLLRALFPQDPELLFSWLRGLSFVRATEEGIVPHDLARDAIDNDLWWRDRERYYEMHGRIRRVIIERILNAAPVLRTGLFRDLLFMHRRSRLFARFTHWGMAGGFSVEPMGTDSVPRVIEIAAKNEGPRSARVTEFWAKRRPECFRVFRNAASGKIEGFVLLLIVSEFAAEECAADPGAEAMRRFVETTAPLRPGECVVSLRQLVIDGAWGQVTHHTDAVAALNGVAWITTQRLAWAFMITGRPELWSPYWRYLDFREMTSFPLDDKRFTLFAHDFRLAPPDAWLDFMEGQELELAPAEGRPPSLEPPLLALSRPDFEQAVRGFLKDFTRPSALEKSTLLRCRLARQAAAQEENASQALKALVFEVARELELDPKRERLFHALELTYLRPAPTQEVAAARLGAPFSTYRRHLTRAVDFVVERLWERELSA